MNFLIFIAIKIAAALAIILTAVPLLVWMERKVSASFQRRIGPNRVGPWGIFQSIADAVKLFFKEKFIPTGADPFIFLAAPVLMFLPGVISFALIPMGEYEMNGERLILSVADIDLGLIIIMAISSLSSYGIAYAGWASSNQYALLGGIRSCAQLISYEIVMVLSVIEVVMM